MTTALIVVGAIAGYIVVVALIVAALCAGGVDDNLADLGSDDDDLMAVADAVQSMFTGFDQRFLDRIGVQP